MSDALASFIDGTARLLAYAGAAALLVGTVFLLMNFSAAGGDVRLQEQALANVARFAPAAVFGGIALAIGIAWLQWGEETLAPLLLIAAAAFFFSGMYVPSLFGEPSPTAAGASALKALQNTGAGIGAVGFVVLFLDILTRARIRAREGSRAEQLKYGKGIKEEADIQNVFLGKCWQLPFCRKFVREKCPIFHARRTCWRERVGCMCEESVIRNAMAGKVVPKDAVAAAGMIPYNRSLSEQKKAERCRQCVIYNEHQKHKYKLALPMSIAGVLAVYALFREPLLASVGAALAGMDKVVRQATLDKVATKQAEGVQLLHELVLGAILLIVLAYMIRTIEFLFFKAKV